MSFGSSNAIHTHLWKLWEGESQIENPFLKYYQYITFQRSKHIYFFYMLQKCGLMY